MRVVGTLEAQKGTINCERGATAMQSDPGG